MTDRKDVIEPLDASFGDVVGAMVPSAAVEPLISATHKGFIHVGDVDLECYVLEDGQRVFHKKGMAKALGLKSAGGNAFLRSMSRKGLGSELGDKLLEKIENPILFNSLGRDPAHGYESEILVEVCKSILRAKSAGKLTSSQDGLVKQATILVNAFAKLGVDAFIDEATGYQRARSPDALRLLMQQYIEDEKREWQKEFPDEYYDELNRMYGSSKMAVRKSGAIVQNKPQHFAIFTREFVYSPLENGAVLAELDKANPKIDKAGTRRNRFHQHLKEEYGLQKLRQQVREVITLLTISDSVPQFKKLFKKRFPQKGDQIPLFDLDQDDI